MAVVFPAPLAPRKPKISPRLTVNEISSTALNGPKCFDNLFTSMTFISMRFHQLHESVFNGCLDPFYFQLGMAQRNEIPFQRVNHILSSQHDVMFLPEGKTG